MKEETKGILYNFLDHANAAYNVGFHNGAEWERGRDHWFSLNELPGDGIAVLVKNIDNEIWIDERYQNRWYNESPVSYENSRYPVIKWAFIPK